MLESLMFIIKWIRDLLRYCSNDNRVWVWFDSISAGSTKSEINDWQNFTLGRLKYHIGVDACAKQY